MSGSRTRCALTCQVGRIVAVVRVGDGCVAPDAEECLHLVRRAPVSGGWGGARAPGSAVERFSMTGAAAGGGSISCCSAGPAGIPQPPTWHRPAATHVPAAIKTHAPAPPQPPEPP
jgi:hypothetical protein